MKFIGVVGSRSRNSEEDFHIVDSVFYDNYEQGDIIVSGGCPKGADRFAEIIATRDNIPIHIFKADWDKLGKKAGFARNTYIAQTANILIACVSIDRIGGTEDTIKKFKEFYPNRKLILC